MDLFKIMGTFAINGAGEAVDDIDNVTSQAKSASGGITSAFKKIGGAIATYLTVDAIKDFGLSCINAAADANAAKSQFTQVFAGMESQARSSLSGIASEAGISENRMKGSFTKIAAFAKTTGLDTESALALSERAMVAVADSAAFYDRSLEDTTESLQSFLKGNYENDAALGLSCTETTRNAAANDLYGKSFNDLSEAQKQLTLLKMVEDANAASGALGQAARESDTWANVTGNLQQAWTDFQAVLGEYVLEGAVDLVKSLAEKVAELTENVPTIVEWFNQWQEVFQLLAVAITIVTAAVTAYNIVQAIQAAMTAAEVTSFGTLIMVKLANAAATLAMIAPYVAVAAVIAMVIAAGVWLYKNWDTVKEKAIELASNLKEKFEEIKTAVTEKIKSMVTAVSDKVTEMKEKASEAVQNMKDKISETVSGAYEAVSIKFTNIKNKITETINGAKDTVESAIDKIKGFFDFEWSLPDLKLPSISISGKFSLNPISVPKFSLSWFAKGGILTEPTLFDYNPMTGNAKVGGEAGPEAVAPISTLQQYVRAAVQSENAQMGEKLERIIDLLVMFFPEALDAMQTPMVLDPKGAAIAMAPAMDAELGKIAIKKGRGR